MDMRAADMRAQGQDIVMLGAGEPDFPTSPSIIERAFDAARQGHTRYTAVAGVPRLRDAIRSHVARSLGIEVERGNVIASSGAKQALYNLMQATLEPGDEVLLPAPCWVSYGDMARLAGAVPVYLPTRYDERFVLTAQTLAQAITPRTRMLILNSPSNPTGTRYDPGDWTALAAVLRRHPDVLVVCDDIYDRILMDAEPFAHFLGSAPDFLARTILVNGVSKSHAMTGWRLGYAVGPPDIVAAMEVIQSQVTSCPSSISQEAAIAALTSGDDDVQRMCQSFRQRHERMLGQLNALPGVRCLPARGAFYLFPDFSAVIERFAERAVIDESTDVALAEYLLSRHRVGIVPGSAFQGPGFMRLSFAAAQATLDAALERLAQALAATH